MSGGGSASVPLPDFPFLVPAADLLATLPPPVAHPHATSFRPVYAFPPSLWACQPPVWVLPAEVESPVYSCPQGLRDHNKTDLQFRGVFIRAHNMFLLVTCCGHCATFHKVTLSHVVVHQHVIKRLCKWMSLEYHGNIQSWVAHPNCIVL